MDTGEALAKAPTGNEKAKSKPSLSATISGLRAAFCRVGERSWITLDCCQDRGVVRKSRKSKDPMGRDPWISRDKLMIIESLFSHHFRLNDFSDYVKKDLIQFAKEHPHVEVIVTPRPSKHPVIRGLYLNGKDKVICVRNMEPKDIAGKVTLLKESSGNKMKVFKKPVISTTESVRGIWSPFHAAPHKI
ncbi:39S ribosomal protein L51, mitochondrial [Dissophora ornata]|nr:39S ribosomal protein L51, mitochondrial [Dissophora ornata]